jgi:hypothetical protein
MELRVEGVGVGTGELGDELIEIGGVGDEHRLLSIGTVADASSQGGRSS